MSSGCVREKLLAGGGLGNRKMSLSLLLGEVGRVEARYFLVSSTKSRLQISAHTRGNLIEVSGQGRDLLQHEDSLRLLNHTRNERELKQRRRPVIGTNSWRSPKRRAMAAGHWPVDLKIASVRPSAVRPRAASDGHGDDHFVNPSSRDS